MRRILIAAGLALWVLPASAQTVLTTTETLSSTKYTFYPNGMAIKPGKRYVLGNYPQSQRGGYELPDTFAGVLSFTGTTSVSVGLAPIVGSTLTFADAPTTPTGTMLSVDPLRYTDGIAIFNAYGPTSATNTNPTTATAAVRVNYTISTTNTP